MHTIVEYYYMPTVLMLNLQIYHILLKGKMFILKLLKQSFFLVIPGLNISNFNKVQQSHLVNQESSSLC